MNLERVKSISFVKILFTLALATICFLSVSYTTYYIFDRFLAEPKFESQAKIGSVSVEGLTRSEAAQKVDQEVKAWQRKPNIVLVWNEKSRPVSSSLVTFDIPATIQQATLSGYSPIVSHVVGDALEVELSKLLEKDMVGNLERTSLEESVLAHVSKLPTESVSLNVIDYIKKQTVPTTIVSQAALINKDKRPVDVNLFSSLNGYTIKPGESFSLLTFSKKDSLSDTERYSYNFLATGIYQMLLHTNFEIVERHIGRVKPSYAELGFEASVIPPHWDLVFKNPNPVSYTLKISSQNDQLQVSLEGAPFSAQYEPYLLGIKELPPKKIVHRNPSLSYGTVNIKEQGQPGYDVEVYRHELNNGNLIGKEFISKDFYAPLHQVEEWGPPIPNVPEPEVSLERESEPTVEEKKEESPKKPSEESDWIIIQ